MKSPFYDMYNTELSPEQRKGLYRHLLDMSLAEGRNRFNDMNDYDMAGAYVENLAQKGDKGFFYDLFKKPNHPVFSDDSRYNGVDGHFGGHWTEGTDEYPGGTFTPSEWNLKNMPPDEMKWYFDSYEPEAKLILPGEQDKGDGDMSVKYVNTGGGGWSPLGLLGSVLSLAVPGAAPFVAGANALNSAVRGDWGGAVKNGASALGGVSSSGSAVPQFGSPDYEDLWHGFNRRR